MKHFKTIITPLAFILSIIACANTHAQSIIGKWQLVKQTSCLEDEVSIQDDTMEDLTSTMKSMSGPSQQVVQFKQKGQGEESTRILNKKKSANNKNFLYKFTGESLLILDKKSQTLSESYTVDRLDADSLILSNSSRACETRIFIKIKDLKVN
jgi:hypothetical protein